MIRTDCTEVRKFISSAIDMDEKPERIAKVMARAGLCSRREAERWISAGRVAVDGKILESPAFTVTKINRIEVDGNPIASPESTRVWRYQAVKSCPGDPEGRHYFQSAGFAAASDFR